MTAVSEIERRKDACRRYELPIRAVAVRLADRTHSWWMYDDLLQAGRLALIECLEAHDPTFGTPFWAFAHHRVTGAMIDEIRRSYPGSRWLRNGQMHVPFDSVAEGVVSADDIFDEVSSSEERERMMEVMQKLTTREQRVVMLRNTGLYLHQIGSVIGCSESRASQIYNRAVRKMRHGVQTGTRVKRPAAKTHPARR